MFNNVFTTFAPEKAANKGSPGVVYNTDSQTALIARQAGRPFVDSDVMEVLMDSATLVTLYDYSYWAAERVLQATRQAGDEAFTAPRAELYYGSLRGTLTHILTAEWIWRMRCQQGISPTSLLDPLTFPTIDSLAARVQEEQAAMRAYLASLTDADLARMVDYRSTKGQPFQNTLWHLLVHVVNHGTQHRSEAAMTLTGLGQSPGDLDMIIYFRQYP